MTSSLTDIREALKATLSQSGLHLYETVPDVTNTPAAVILPDDADYLGAMRMGGDTYNFDVAVLVASRNIRDAQRKLDRYVTGQGENSLREFLYHNSGLGLPDVDATVKGFKGYGGNFQQATVDCIGAVLRVCVVVT